jgi:hypothetical protein
VEVILDVGSILSWTILSAGWAVEEVLDPLGSSDRTDVDRNDAEEFGIETPLCSGGRFEEGSDIEDAPKPGKISLKLG